MARFFARFDAGTAGWNSGFAAELEASSYFNRLRVGATSASGAGWRDGLIASRSALSADIYADLDSGNQDGSKGIYFPPDSGPYSTNGSTFVSWSNAYTSSIDGIKTPITNTYAVGQTVNYSKRPTASIRSTDTTFVGPALPVDPVGASYSTYTAATNAVKAAIDAIQTTGSSPLTPYTRPGNFPSRTLHSIWMDPNLTYIAWDDFTPGTPTGTAANWQSGPTCLTTGPSGGDYGGTIRVQWTGTYANDINPEATASIRLYRQGYGNIAVYETSCAGPTGQYLFDIPYSETVGNLNPTTNTTFDLYIKFSDVNIRASEGPEVLAGSVSWFAGNTCSNQ